MTPEDILQRFTQAIVAGSADDLAELYAEDAVHEFPFTHTDKTTLHGRERIRARYRAAWDSMPATVRAASNLIVHRMAEGETTVAEFDLTLENTSTHLQFVASTVVVMRVRDGAIAHLRDYTDNLTLERGLGLPPRPAP
ncbi:MAG TPA: nuclear transport factor 2 family protein [Caulobacteraceae bacterium]|jgi:ketosteroid isomerase-like protein